MMTDNATVGGFEDVVMMTDNATHQQLFVYEDDDK